MNAGIIRLNRLDNVNYEELRGFEKAAILINYLGPDACRKLFKFVDDGDVRKLLGVVEPDTLPARFVPHGAGGIDKFTKKIQG